MYCPICGKKQTDNATFCFSCGSDLKQFSIGGGMSNSFSNSRVAASKNDEINTKEPINTVRCAQCGNDLKDVGYFILGEAYCKNCAEEIEYKDAKSDSATGSSTLAIIASFILMFAGIISGAGLCQNENTVIYGILVIIASVWFCAMSYAFCTLVQSVLDNTRYVKNINEQVQRVFSVRKRNILNNNDLRTEHRRT